MALVADSPRTAHRTMRGDSGAKETANSRAYPLRKDAWRFGSHKGARIPNRLQDCSAWGIGDTTFGRRATRAPYAWVQRQARVRGGRAGEEAGAVARHTIGSLDSAACSAPALRKLANRPILERICADAACRRPPACRIASNPDCSRRIVTRPRRTHDRRALRRPAESLAPRNAPFPRAED